jgi:DNA repair protein RecO (recombination protein O)
MFLKQRTEGIFLKYHELNWADKIFIVLTKDFGKIEILAKGIRKISSKLRYSVDLFFLSEIEFIQGKNYKTLTDSFPIEKFEKIREEDCRYKIALMAAEIIDYFLPLEEEDLKIWNFLKSFFEKLNSVEIAFLPILYYHFLWRFLAILGYKPGIKKCLICGKKIGIAEKTYFSFQEGGIICRNCSSKIKEEDRKFLSEIYPNTRKIINHFLTQKFKKIKISKKDQENLNLIARSYLEFLKQQL